MFRLVAIVLALCMLAAPVYAGCGGGYYGGYGASYSGCGGGYSASSYSGCGSYGVPYRVQYAPVYSGCLSSRVTYSSDACCVPSATATVTTSPVQQPEVKQESVLPPGYYDGTETPADPTGEPTPALKPEPKPGEPTPADPNDKPLAPAEAFSMTSYKATSIEKPVVKKPVVKKPKIGDGIIIISKCHPNAKVYINGHLTNITGPTRKYVSKGLIAGKVYRYDVVMVNPSGQKGRGVAKLTAGHTFRFK